MDQSECPANLMVDYSVDDEVFDRDGGARRGASRTE
jgi:hypothetical protein